MTLEFFKNVVTAEELHNYIALSKSLVEEGQVRDKDAFHVTGSPYESLDYIVSTRKGDAVLSHWLYYKEGSFRGLARVGVGSSDLEVLTDAEYVKFDLIGEGTWLLQHHTGVYHVFANKHVLECDVINYEKLALGDYLIFVYLIFDSCKSLLCNNMMSPTTGLFVPADEMDFRLWFDQTVTSMGYSGAMDNVPLSHVIQCYFDVYNFAFKTGRYSSLSLS